MPVAIRDEVAVPDQTARLWTDYEGAVSLVAGGPATGDNIAPWIEYPKSSFEDVTYLGKMYLRGVPGETVKARDERVVRELAGSNLTEPQLRIIAQLRRLWEWAQSQGNVRADDTGILMETRFGVDVSDAQELADAEKLLNAVRALGARVRTDYSTQLHRITYRVSYEITELTMDEINELTAAHNSAISGLLGC